jgi:cytoskeletal protein CcmA (bactofilin family)
MIKKDKSVSPSENATISTLLGRDTSFEGTLGFKETIRVDGRIKGKLTSTDGTVIVGENAVIDADIQVAVAIIRGKITGRIEAGQRIEIYPPAKIDGDISAPTVAIDSGVLFNGTCQMTDSPIKGFKGNVKTPDTPEDTAVASEKNAKNL